MRRSELVRKLTEAAPADTDPDVFIVADGAAWGLGSVEAVDDVIALVESP